MILTTEMNLFGFKFLKLKHARKHLQIKFRIIKFSKKKKVLQ